MSIFQRVINILKSPKTEWEVIKNETATPISLSVSYVLPLSLLSAAGSLISMTGRMPGISIPFSIYAKTAVITIVVAVISFYIASYIMDQLATSFASEKDINKSAQLVAYSLTASYVGGFLVIVPFIGWLLSIAGFVYAIYIMYHGLSPMKKTPEDKKVVYLIVSFAIIFVVQLLISGILMYMFIGSALQNPYVF